MFSLETMFALFGGLLCLLIVSPVVLTPHAVPHFALGIALGFGSLLLLAPYLTKYAPTGTTRLNVMGFGALSAIACRAKAAQDELTDV